MAPLGSPVVPPVYCSSATSSSETLGHCGGLLAPSTNFLNVTIAGSAGLRLGGLPTPPPKAPSTAAPPPPTVVLADALSVKQPLLEELQGPRHQRWQIAGDENVRSPVGQPGPRC